MNQLHTMLMMLLIVAAAGIMFNFLVESVNAWHSQFSTKKECTNYMKSVVGNTTAQAQAMCNKVIPH